MDVLKTCLACLQAMTGPHMVGPCGHTVCKPCVDIFHDSDVHQCPTCAAPMTQPVPDIAYAALLEQLCAAPDPADPAAAAADIADPTPCKRRKVAPEVDPEGDAGFVLHEIARQEVQHHKAKVCELVEGLWKSHRGCVATYLASMESAAKNADAVATVQAVNASFVQALTDVGGKARVLHVPVADPLPVFAAADYTAVQVLFDAKGDAAASAAVAKWHRCAVAQSNPGVLIAQLDAAGTLAQLLECLPVLTQLAKEGMDARVLAALEQAVCRLVPVGPLGTDELPMDAVDQLIKLLHTGSSVKAMLVMMYHRSDFAVAADGLSSISGAAIMRWFAPLLPTFSDSQFKAFAMLVGNENYTWLWDGLRCVIRFGGPALPSALMAAAIAGVGRTDDLAAASYALHFAAILAKAYPAVRDAADQDAFYAAAANALRLAVLDASPHYVDSGSVIAYVLDFVVAWPGHAGLVAIAGPLAEVITAHSGHWERPTLLKQAEAFYRLRYSAGVPRLKSAGYHAVYAALVQHWPWGMNQWIAECVQQLE